MTSARDSDHLDRGANVPATPSRRTPTDLTRIGRPFDHSPAHLDRQAVPPFEYLEPAGVVEPDWHSPPPARRRSRRNNRDDIGLTALLAAALVGLVVFTSALLSAPSRSPLAAPLATPLATPLTTPLASPLATIARGATGSPVASAKGTAVTIRGPVDVNIATSSVAKQVFASEVSDTMCASSAVQMAVELLTHTVDTSGAFQNRIKGLIRAATVPADSRRDGAGPAAMAVVIGRLSGDTYELRAAPTRAAALLDAARAIKATGKPAILLVWRGWHTWVMTGYRATADPGTFPDATVSGAYILDPWYPRVSTIWGRSDPPGTFQVASEMVRNYLPWKQPDAYPGRDGRFIYLVPLVQ